MEKRITIKDIARLAGVSTTTVYKVLHGKPKVGEEVRKRILQIAAGSDYRPNRNAQALARRRMRIVAVLPDEPGEFQKFIVAGCREALAACEENNIATALTLSGDGRDWRIVRAALERLLAGGADGILIEPGSGTEHYADLLEKAAAAGAAVMTVVGNSPFLLPSAGSVTIHTEAVGGMAAQIMAMNVAPGAPVVIFAGDANLPLHRSYIDAFRKEAARSAMTVAGVFETREQYGVAYSLTASVLERVPKLGGIYVCSYNSVAVCDCLRERGLAGKISVVGQDLYKPLAAHIRDGSLCATIFQNPRLQGRRAVELLASQLISGGRTPQVERITPLLVMRSNLSCYLREMEYEKKGAFA